MVNPATMQIYSGTCKVGDVIVSGTADYNAGKVVVFYYVTSVSGSVYGHRALSKTKSWLAEQRVKNERQADVIADDGTVPDDGIHTDGYWYVKIKPTFPTMRILWDGQWIEAESGFVLKDGVWKPIEDVFVLKDGQWKNLQ